MIAFALASCAKQATIVSVRDPTDLPEIKRLFITERTEYLTVQKSAFHDELTKAIRACGVEVETDFAALGSTASNARANSPEEEMRLGQLEARVDPDAIRDFKPDAILRVSGVSFMMKGPGAKDAKMEFTLKRPGNPNNIWRARTDFDFGEVPIAADGAGWAMLVVDQMKKDSVFGFCR